MHRVNLLKTIFEIQLGSALAGAVRHCSAMSSQGSSFFYNEFYGERFGTTGFNKPRRSQSMPRRPGGRDALLASVSTRIAQTEFIPAAGAPSGQPVPPDAYSKFGSSIERIPRRMEPRTMVPSMGLDRRFQTMKHDRKWYTYNDIPRRPGFFLLP